MVVAVAIVAVMAVAGVVATASPLQLVPFTLHRDYLILVEGSLGQLGGLRFAIDTGASRTVICRDRATSLGLQGQPTSLVAFGERAPAVDVEVPEIKFGPVVARKQFVLAAELSPMAASLGLSQLDGLIGLDMLRATTFAIDFGQRRLVFGGRRRLPFTVPLSRDSVLVVVDASLDSTPVRLSIDSGVSHLVLFNQEAPGRSQAHKHIKATHLAGDVKAGITGVDRFRIGRWSHDGLAAVVLPASASAPVGTDGAVGLRALGADYVQFDFERHEVGWRP